MTINIYNPDNDSYDRPVELTPWAVNWIISGSKVIKGYDPFGRLAERTKMTEEAIARADRLIAELDPFQADDTQPEVEEEYDPYQEWQEMTSQMRKGE